MYYVSDHLIYVFVCLLLMSVYDVAHLGKRSPKNGFRSTMGWLAWGAVAGGSQPPWRWEIAPAISR